MSIDWNELRDYDGSGDKIDDEVITIPVSSPYEVYPEFWPQKNQPTSIELWTGISGTGTQYTEKTDKNQIAASGDFYVNYNRGGLLTTYSTSAELSLYLSYHEIGTFERAKYLNSIRNIVGSGDVSDAAGNVNLVTHANDDSIHGQSGDVAIHATTHHDSGTDELDIKDLADADSRLLSAANKTDLTDGGETALHSHAGTGAHASNHFDGGSDEVDLARLKPSGDVDFASHKITSLLDPANNQDGATKKYVDDNAGAGAALAIAGTVNKGNWIVQTHDVTRILTGEVFEAIDLFIAGVLAIDGKLTVTG